MKILVISSNLIGDTILSTSIIEKFRELYPNALFTFVIGPSASQIYKNFPATEKIIIVKKRKYNLHWLEMYRQLWRTKWGLVIDLRSSVISYFLITQKKFIFKKNKDLNQVEQLANSFKFKSLSLYVHTSTEEDIEANENIDKKYRHIVIFPGGNWKPKIWPANYYNELIHLLRNQFSNLKFVIVGSSAEKNIYIDILKKNLPDEIFINLMGYSLTATTAYMNKCNLFFGNDSGLMHLSVASKLTTIALFGPTNDMIYGHKSINSFVLRTEESYDYFNKLIIDPTKSYMSSVKPQSVFNFVINKKLL